MQLCLKLKLTWGKVNWPLVIFSVQEEEKRKAKEEEEKREYEEYLKLRESFVVEEEGVEESMTEEEVCVLGCYHNSFAFVRLRLPSLRSASCKMNLKVGISETFLLVKAIWW